jgi:type 1 glutamine amidotransferase
LRNYEKGRVFYCGLGHNNEVIFRTPILQHYLDGIQFALGDLKVDAAPVKQ